jgi:Fe2+ or Zn2+ uptake regulation protein
MKATRNTLQRQIILEALRKFNCHPTVEDVYLLVKENYPTISKATVYRNLRQLADQGEIRKANLPCEQERYDNINSKHYHFQCNVCGDISDVEMDYATAIDLQAENCNSFQVDEHEIIFKGICANCKKNREGDNS